jgi:hypothetical protein
MMLFTLWRRHFYSLFYIAKAKLLVLNYKASILPVLQALTVAKLPESYYLIGEVTRADRLHSQNYSQLGPGRADLRTIPWFIERILLTRKDGFRAVYMNIEKFFQNYLEAPPTLK